MYASASASHRPQSKDRPGTSIQNLCRPISLACFGLLALFVVFAIWHYNRPHFIVQHGDSLVRKVGYGDALTLADKNGLPIFAGRRGNPRFNQVPYAEARKLDTKMWQVTVPICTGDIVDLRNGWEFTPGPNNHNGRCIR